MFARIYQCNCIKMQRSYVVPFALYIYNMSRMKNLSVIFKALDIIEKYYEQHKWKENDFYLITATAMMIANKYEEEDINTNMFRIVDCYYYATYGPNTNYGRKDILSTEIMLLKLIDYRLLYDTYYDMLYAEIHNSEHINLYNNVIILSLLLPLPNYDVWSGTIKRLAESCVSKYTIGDMDTYTQSLISTIFRTLNVPRRSMNIRTKWLLNACSVHELSVIYSYVKNIVNSYTNNANN